MRRLLRCLSSVTPGEELVEACDFMVDDLGKNPCEPGLRIDVIELCGLDYRVDEIASAVEAASFFDTYVTVHAYTDETVNMALDAGVKSIEHGQMVTEETVKRIADEGIFLGDQRGRDGPAASEPSKLCPTDGEAEA